jgi:hypothetical protein
VYGTFTPASSATDSAPKAHEGNGEARVGIKVSRAHGWDSWSNVGLALVHTGMLPVGERLRGDMGDIFLQVGIWSGWITGTGEGWIDAQRKEPIENLKGGDIVGDGNVSQRVVVGEQVDLGVGVRLLTSIAWAKTLTSPLLEGMLSNNSRISESIGSCRRLASRAR